MEEAGKMRCFMFASYYLLELAFGVFFWLALAGLMVCVSLAIGNDFWDSVVRGAVMAVAMPVMLFFLKGDLFGGFLPDYRYRFLRVGNVVELKCCNKCPGETAVVVLPLGCHQLVIPDPLPEQVTGEMLCKALNSSMVDLRKQDWTVVRYPLSYVSHIVSLRS